MEVKLTRNPLKPRGFAISFQWSQQNLETLKRCLDAYWDPGLKAWLSEGPEILMDFQRFGITIAWISAEARALAEAFRHEIWASMDARMMDISEEKWDFQRQGTAWLSSLSSAILGDDMGVGKSKQSLDAALDEPEVLTMTSRALGQGAARVLVVCGKTQTYNWKNEISKWHPSWNARVVPNDRRSRNNRAGEHIMGRDEFWEDPPKIVITTFDKLLRDDWPFDMDWDILICDEIGRFKNSQTVLFKRIIALSQIVLNDETWFKGVRHVWFLTGTPMEKRIQELWNIFNILRPGMLGRWMRFRDQHLETDDDGRIVGIVNLELLRERVGPFMLRRTKKEVMPWLPPKLYHNALIEFSPQELAAYATFKSSFHNWLTEHSISGGNNPMMQTLRMRQFCCSPMIFTDELGRGSKYEELYDVLDSWPGQVVIFCYFEEMISLLGQWFRPHPRALISGSVNDVERFRRVEDFNAGRLGKVFLSTDAGNAGLNMVGADLIVHYDQGFFNAMKMKQREDRLLREGQEADSVNVLNMLMLDSIDVGMYQLNREEETLFSEVIEGAESMMMRRLNTPRWQQVIDGRLDGVDGRSLIT